MTPTQHHRQGSSTRQTMDQCPRRRRRRRRPRHLDSLPSNSCSLVVNYWVLISAGFVLVSCAVSGQELTYDYENVPFPPPGVQIRSPSDYLLIRRLGYGKFSDVFEAVDKRRCHHLNIPIGDDQDLSYSAAATAERFDPRTLVIIKCLKPVPVKKIKREIVILQHASRLPNLARLSALVLPSHFVSSDDSGSISNTDGVRGAKGDSKLHRKQQQGDDHYHEHIQFEEKVHPMPSLVLEHGHGEWLCHPVKLKETGNVNSSTANFTSGATHSNVHDKDRSIDNDHTQDADYLSPDEVRFYLYHLLVALDQLHTHGIMHRDVKPRNVLIDRKRKRLMLIDLGLADFFTPQTPYNVRVASRHYKSPELLLGYHDYDYGIDLWGFGCIMAGLIFYKEPFFRGKDNVDQLATIVSVLGTADLHRYMASKKIAMSSDVRKIIAKYRIQGGTGYPKDWREFIPKESSLQKDSLSPSSQSFRSQSRRPSPPPLPPPPSPESIDLLSKILRYNHKERLTAKEAMAHTYFDPIRMEVEDQLYQNRVQNDHGTINNIGNHNIVSSPISTTLRPSWNP